MLLALAAAAAAAPFPESVQATVFYESTGAVLADLSLEDANPGVTISAPVWQVGRHVQGRLVMELGTLHHAAETVVWALPTLGLRAWPLPSLGLSGQIGVGYRHAFSAHRPWVLDQGVYRLTRSVGRPGATVQAGVGVALRVASPYTVVVEYRGVLDGPSSLIPEEPLLFRRTLHVGLEVRR